MHLVFQLKVVDEEKSDYHDLLLISDDNYRHFTYIVNYSRLICSQKSLRNKHAFFCKRCFNSFENKQHKFKLSDRAALEEHKTYKWGQYNAIHPQMPVEGTILLSG